MFIMMAANLLSAKTKDNPSVVSENIKGCRFQIYNALSWLGSGQRMVVQQSCPPHVKSEQDYDNWVFQLKNDEAWIDYSLIVPISVPGTMHGLVVGNILLKERWCSVSPKIHWVPSIRSFYLNENGYKALSSAQNWWENLTFVDKLKLRVCE